MQYYAKITFCLDNDCSFSNLSGGPIQLFRDGDASCIAREDNRFPRHRIIMEYGAFSTREEAEKRGTNLVRRIKLDMIKREYPIKISDGIAGLDNPTISIVFGGFSEWVKLCEKHNIKYRDKIIENEYIGLGIYEVRDSLKEILFVGGEGSAQVSQKLILDNAILDYWDEYMDISLSLLSSSIGINDIRVAFILRLMAIEALVSKSQSREETYVSTIKQLCIKIDQMDISDEYKTRLKGQLGMFKEKSISQKVSELLRSHLTGKQYLGLTAEKLFAQCYSARSGFVHTGKLTGVDGEIIRELKTLCMDLLYSMSNTKIDS